MYLYLEFKVTLGVKCSLLDAMVDVV